MTSAYKKSDTPAEEAKATAIRWNPEVYSGLRAVATGSNSSINYTVNSIVSTYLVSQAAQTAYEAGATATTASQDALMLLALKLSGAPDA